MGCGALPLVLGFWAYLVELGGPCITRRGVYCQGDTFDMDVLRISLLDFFWNI